MIININDDFDQEKIRISGQAFRIRRLDDDSYSYIHKGKVLCVKKLAGNEYDVSCDKKDWDSIWAEYFDLGRNYRKIRSGINKEDTFLKESADAGKGIRILRQDSFEMLITFIISQRKNIPAIMASVEKICRLFGDEILNTGSGSADDNEVIYAFPTPEQLYNADEEKLKTCSLGYRLPYIQDAATRVCDGRLNLDDINSLSDEDLFEKLKEVHGVGDKVSNCICLFGYGRVAMAPVDTWIKKVIDEEYNGINPFPGYGRNAGIMQQYMFYHARV